MGWGKLGKSGNAAFRAFHGLAAAGAWEGIWRAVIAHAGEEGFTPEQLGRATAWLKAAGAIAGEGWPEPPPQAPIMQQAAAQIAEETESEAAPAAKAANALWTAIEPLWEPHIQAAKTGRKRMAGQDLLARVMEKLRTGKGWKQLDRGTAAFRHFLVLVAAGVWEATWRAIVATASHARSGTSWTTRIESAAGRDARKQR